MDRFDDDTMLAELRELRELRPKPRPEFTAELDERAAAGFPRRPNPSKSVTPFTLLAEHWRDLSPRRRLMPVLAVAFAALVVATAVVAISGSGTKSNPAEDAVVGVVPSAGESGVSAEESVSGGAESAAPTGPRGGHKSSSHSNGGGEAGSEAVYAPAVPSVETGTSSTKSAGGGEAAAGEGSAAGSEERAVEESGGGEEAGEIEGELAEESSSSVESESAESAGPVFAPENAPNANSAVHRDIERSAYVVLGTKPGEVGSASGKVYEAVHAAHGIVLHSSVDSGSKGATGAIFELLIPTGKVDDALASISQIAEVRARHDATTDITEPTVDAAEELADSNASIEGLLKELGNVETEAERESVEARLREARRQHAADRASLDHLRERGAMSEVTVRIVSSHGANATPPAAGSDGSWGVGDALHDAGQILTIAAGVVLIGLAFLAPIALIALLFWLGNRFRVRRLRERALG
jgi:hypothetical protein